MRLAGNKNQNKMKPLHPEQYGKVYGKDPLIDFFLMTGLRREEALDAINTYDYNRGYSYVYIPRKFSQGKTVLVYLNDEARELLTSKKLWQFNGVSLRTINRHVKKVSEEIGIDFTPHNLRATFATRLLSRGVDLVSVQTLMNHRDIRTTAEYIKINSEELSDAVASLGDSYRTLDGMTMAELKKENFKLIKLNKKLERKNERLRGRYE